MEIECYLAEPGDWEAWIEHRNEKLRTGEWEELKKTPPKAIKKEESYRPD